MSNDLAALSITNARAKLDAREITALQLAQACKANIDARNKELNVFLEVFDDIEAQAKAADERIARGETTPLLGIPLAIKDNILIEGR
ncbi:MAG TPA: amidase family protein, partial [Candidatus Paceibacterota bacterium]|nr:amidase family protein [Candidatus Paceibacterota bacterium]